MASTPSCFNFLKEGALLPTHNRKLFAAVFVLAAASATTGNPMFAECRMHSAKAKTHSAKSLPSVTLGKDHTANSSRQRVVCREFSFEHTANTSPRAKNNTRQTFLEIIKKNPPPPQPPPRRRGHSHHHATAAAAPTTPPWPRPPSRHRRPVQAAGGTRRRRERRRPPLPPHARRTVDPAAVVVAAPRRPCCVSWSPNQAGRRHMRPAAPLTVLLHAAAAVAAPCCASRLPRRAAPGQGHGCLVAPLHAGTEPPPLPSLAGVGAAPHLAGLGAIGGVEGERDVGERGERWKKGERDWESCGRERDEGERVTGERDEGERWKTVEEFVGGGIRPLADKLSLDAKALNGTDQGSPEFAHLIQEIQDDTRRLLLVGAAYSLLAVVVGSIVRIVVLFAAVATYSGELQHTFGSLLGRAKAGLKGPVVTLAFVYALEIAYAALVTALIALLDWSRSSVTTRSSSRRPWSYSSPASSSSTSPSSAGSASSWRWPSPGAAAPARWGARGG
ncbi:hypothetical protein EJB05_43436, partial [Eragrostis curvula]